MAPPSTAVSRPWRAIAALIGLLIVLVLLILGGNLFRPSRWSEEMAPKLALDLSGGTTVTLQAQTPDGAPPSAESMNQAIEIMRQRVNGTGVAEAEVTKEGTNVIVVAVPGQGQEDLLRLVGSTAELRFRQVLLVGPGAPQPVPSPSASPSGSATPSARPSASASPAPSGSPGATASPSSRPRALSSALTGRAEAPTPTPTQTAPQQPVPPQPSAPPPGAPPEGDTSDVDPAVLQQYEQLDCTKADSENQPADDPAKQLVACDEEGTAKYVLDKAEVLGTEIAGARAENNPQDLQGWRVTLDFRSKGTTQFGQLTSRVVSLQPPRNQVAIVLDGRVISAPAIQEAITGGSAEITGDFTQKEAGDLANVLKYGALPLKFNQQAVEAVSATLGKDQLTGGLIAGAIGLGLVILYSFFYYRGLAGVVVLSLGVAALATFLAVVLLGQVMNFRLSLAGIAGLIVAIGITADSFIVYFERLRDEVRDGRSLRAAVERGWQRARRTIIVADAVSFIAALMLWFFSIGGVKGFAFTLGLTTLIDVAVVFLFTKPMVTLLAGTKFFSSGHRLSGLDPRRLGVVSPIRGTRPARTPQEA